MSKPLITLKDVSKGFSIRGGFFQKSRGTVQAVDRVSMDIFTGETLGLVGESGCGKTTLGRLIMGLLETDSGTIAFCGRDLRQWLREDESELRRQVQMVFQDPMDSLDPRFTIARSIEEPLLNDKSLSKTERAAKVREALADVQLPNKVLRAYPHELSGGQRQRIGIARAMIVNPAFVLCDEPVSSLDLSIQVQVLRLLRGLQRKHQTTYLFISHDLAVVSAVSDRIAVMYLGSVVEYAPAREVLKKPLHPYTQALLAAMPHADPARKGSLKPLSGDPPLAHQRPPGCRFRTRCPLAETRCAEQEPVLEQKSDGHWVACHLVD